MEDENDRTGTTFVIHPAAKTIIPKCGLCEDRSFKSLGALAQHFAKYHATEQNPPRYNNSFWTKRVDVTDGDTIVCRKSSTRWECGGCKQVCYTGKGFFTHMSQSCAARISEDQLIKRREEFRAYQKKRKETASTVTEVTKRVTRQATKKLKSNEKNSEAVISLLDGVNDSSDSMKDDIEEIKKSLQEIKKSLYKLTLEKKKTVEIKDNQFLDKHLFVTCSNPGCTNEADRKCYNCSQDLCEECVEKVYKNVVFDQQHQKCCVNCIAYCDNITEAYTDLKKTGDFEEPQKGEYVYCEWSVEGKPKFYLGQMRQDGQTKFSDGTVVNYSYGNDENTKSDGFFFQWNYKKKVKVTRKGKGTKKGKGN